MKKDRPHPFIHAWKQADALSKASLLLPGALTSLDVSGWDTSNVTNMNNMFYICRSLTSLDVSGLDTSNVTNMYNMSDNRCSCVYFAWNSVRAAGSI